MIWLRARFEANLENGEDVAFQIGDIVLCAGTNGQSKKLKIDSKFAVNPDSKYGYEAIDENGDRVFIPDNLIINWEGKP